MNCKTYQKTKKCLTKGAILLLMLFVTSEFSYAQYVPWNATPERESQTINEWLWMLTSGYKNHFFNYSLECLQKLDYCNRNRRNTEYSEDINKLVETYTDSLKNHLFDYIESVCRNYPAPIFYEDDLQGTHVIFPDDIRIAFINIPKMIDANNRAIQFIQDITKSSEINFDEVDDKTKRKFLMKEVPYQKGGWFARCWREEGELIYRYLYHIPRKAHYMEILHLGTFTIDQLKHINQILQHILKNHHSINNSKL